MRCLVVGAAALCLIPGIALAQQPFETVGSRALGMGGAFVAVADDATAVYWNPAGLATATTGSLSIEWVRFQTGDRSVPPAAGPGQRSASFFSAATVPLAVSYTNLQFTDLVAGGGGAGPTAQTLRVSQYGLTVVQSLVQGVIIGTTLKLLNGFAAEEPASGASVAQALTEAGALQANSVTRFDLDVGLMIEMDKVRLGATVKNLRSPSFPIDAENAISLKRQARAGLAVLPTNGLTLALDVDLDTVDLQGGLRRMIAFGAEQRFGHRVAVRGGVRWSLVGDRLPAGAVGLSVAFRRGLWLDGQYTRGGVDADRGFGVALRAGF